MVDRPGPLLIIGGHEDKEGDRVILKEVAKRLDGGRLVIATVASHEPDGYFDAYVEAFRAIGVTDLIELYVHERADSGEDDIVGRLDGVAGVFFTGGDQLRLTATAAKARRSPTPSLRSKEET